MTHSDGLRKICNRSKRNSTPSQNRMTSPSIRAESSSAGTASILSFVWADLFWILRCCPPRYCTGSAGGLLRLFSEQSGFGGFIPGLGLHAGGFGRIRVPALLGAPQVVLSSAQLHLRTTALITAPNAKRKVYTAGQKRTARRLLSLIIMSRARSSPIFFYRIYPSFLVFF